jgi:hypothetical protein
MSNYPTKHRQPQAPTERRSTVEIIAK